MELRDLIKIAHVIIKINAKLDQKNLKYIKSLNPQNSDRT